MTRVGSRLSTARKRLKQGRTPSTRAGSSTEPAVKALALIVDDPSPGGIATALAKIERLPDVKIYRRELLDEMKRTLRSVEAGEFETFSEAAWAIRDRARHRGRRTARRIVSRTLLVKGLEFNHVVVLDPYELDAKNLYVAMTRGTDSLTVLTNGGEKEVHYEGAV